MRKKKDCPHCRMAKMIRLSHAYVCENCQHIIFDKGVENANIYTKSTMQGKTKNQEERQ